MATAIPEFDGGKEGFKEKLPYVGGEGTVLVKLVDAREGTAKDTNLPYVCVDWEVEESTNPNHPVGTKCVDFVGLTGFYWKKDLSYLFAGITGNPPSAMSTKLIAALIEKKDQVLVGRKVLIQARREPYTNKKGESKIATKKFYTCKSNPL